MRLGIHPMLKRADGGIYQYSVTLLRALDALSREDARDGETPNEYVVLAHDPHDPALRDLRPPVWSVQPFRRPGSGSGCPAPPRPDPDRPAAQPDMRHWMIECGIEWMLYPAPHRLSFEADIPFVMAVHDIQHRLQPRFPEVSADGEWERREYVLRNAARRATLLIAESPAGREDLLRHYGEFGLTADQVKVLPYLQPPIPAAEISQDSLRARLSLPDRFFLYPAQFWPHKNHLRIVQALGLLKRRHGLCASIVLVGSAAGTLRERTRAEMLNEAERLGVREQLLLPGYVEDAVLDALYRRATALIMPTFFGPTNIPILEAWSRGCPVLTSDIRGVRDQAGDAALLVDPADVESLAEGMRNLWTDESLRTHLAARGAKRIREYTAGNFHARLREILEEAWVKVSRNHTLTAGV